ncbi:hypothetical protein MMC13_003165 [Lambiella insularis]|nr:hypothetical protein [Lambiella insularis]
MANLSAEAIESDPSATSIANDETVNAGEISLPASLDAKATGEGVSSTDQSDDVTSRAAAAEDTVKASGGDVPVKTDGHAAIADTNKAASEPEKDESVKIIDSDKPVKSNEEVESNKEAEPNQDLSREVHSRPTDRKGYSSRGGRGDKMAGHYNRPRKNFSDNVKSDLTSQEESSDPVEFYFSDSNLHLDEFLYSKVDGHKNNPIPLSIIHAFKRMRHFQPYSAIVAALKESTVLNLVDNDSAVQRKVPLAEELQNKDHQEVKKVYEGRAMARTVYVKGFGPEKHSTQFDLEAFFTPFGPVNSVRLRRNYEKQFKGSVFVEFDSADTAKAFLALEPPPEWNGKGLMIKSKKQYCDEKVEEIHDGRMTHNGKGRYTSHKQNQDGGDNRDWKERRDEDQKKGFKDGRSDKHHRGFGSRRGRGSDKARRGGHDRNSERQKLREAPKVAATSEDSSEPNPRLPATANGSESTASANGTTAVKETPAQDQAESASKALVRDEISEKQVNATMTDVKEDGTSEAVAKPVDDKEESKKRPHVDDESSDVQQIAKKVDIKAGS